MAAALPPLRLCRITLAPASPASPAVPSVDPSSTTTTSSTPGSPDAPATVSLIRSDSFLAGMTTATSLFNLPPSRALRRLREACPRRRDTATAPGAPYAAFGPAPAACQSGASASAPLRSGACGDPRVPGNRAAGPGEDGLVLLAGDRWQVVFDGEHGLKPGHLQDLAHGQARRGQGQVPASLDGHAVRGEQHVHAGRVAELNRRHIHHDLRRLVVRQDGRQFALQPRRRVQVDLASKGKDDVITLGPARYPQLHVPHLTGPSGRRP